MEGSDLNQSYILLQPFDGVEPKENTIKSRINKALNQEIPVHVKIEELNDVPYSEYLIHIDCEFDDNIPTEIIISRFCEDVFHGIGESRLVLHKAFLFETLKCRNDDILLDSFSLGSVVGLTTFVEHYNTSWSRNSSLKRITQLKADFVHDFSKLVVNFVVADKTVPKIAFDGRSHRLHCMEILYSSIQAIIIDKQTKTKNKCSYDLYLQISSAPTLKKLELKGIENEHRNTYQDDSDDDDGEEDLEDNILNDKLCEDFCKYVSCNDKTPQTFLVRAVSFGGDDEDYKRDIKKKAKGLSNGSHLIPENKPSIKKKKKSNSGKSQNTNMESSTKPLAQKTENDAYCSSKTYGMCRTIKLSMGGEKAWLAIEQLVNCCNSQAEVYFASLNVKEMKKDATNPSISVNYFDCYYALKCLLSVSYNIADELFIKNELTEINQILKTKSEKNSEALEQALYDIHYCLEKGHIINFKRALLKLCSRYENGPVAARIRADIAERMVEMRRAILTPTRFIFLPPIPQLKSSLLRNCDPGFAIRVTLRDDNFDQLTFTLTGTKTSRMKFLLKHFAEKLTAGFKIGRRNYDFLGSSTSQLREHGSFFYAKDNEGRTADSLRSGIGDLAKITNVPKFMARMGQSLSQAMTRIVLKKKFVETIDDTLFASYNFTDGIGKISPKAAQMIYKALDLDPDDKPSAFQIRYGGSKGMLVVDPTLEPHVKVCFRKSQIKFESNQESLEILKTSKPQRAFLNRPFITILEQMGIQPSRMLKLQSQTLTELIGSLTDSSSAMKILKERATLRLPYSRLHYCGFDLSAEPFFKPIVMYLYRSAIGELKHKARIQIPFDQSRTMFGVVDETNTLEYGQVFFQYSDISVEGKVSRTAKCHTGTVLVTKNPCMHPGDVRKFEAVDIESLHHIKDCLVFPQQGERPHPDEMAGSDLDGDEYVVIWYDDLIFERNNFTAMDYSNDREPLRKDDIKVEDMTHFMCQYIMDDCVGLIASAHLALADKRSIFEPLLTGIAKKYSVTLDFAKSGNPEKLDYNERPKMYPDFMEKFQSKQTYLSQNTLGKLFRNCKRIEMVSEILDDEMDVTIDEDLIYPGWEKYEDDAKNMLQEYIRLLLMPTKMFNLTKEGEIMSGAIKKIEKTFQGKNSKENMDMALDCIIPHVFKKCSQLFYEEFSPKFASQEKSGKNQVNNFIQQEFIKVSHPTDSPKSVECNSLLDEMLKKISAWYIVAYNAKINNTSTCLGLPWTVPELMGLLKAQARLKRMKRDIPLSEKNVQNFINNLEFNTLHNANELNEQQKALHVVKNWLLHYDEFLSMRGLRKDQPYVLNILHSTFSEQNPDASSAQLVLHFFRTLSKHCYSEYDEAYNWKHKELGMLALVTLSNVFSAGKLWLSPQTDTSMSMIRMGNLTKDFREQILFPLDIHSGPSLAQNDRKKKVNAITFRRFVFRNESDVKETLKSMTGMKNIDLECIETIQCGRSTWHVILTVYGKMWCIESLKDFVIQPNFAKILRITTEQELTYYEKRNDED